MCAEGDKITYCDVMLQVQKACICCYGVSPSLVLLEVATAKACVHMVCTIRAHGIMAFTLTLVDADVKKRQE